jgi:3-hydroxymyristoyl/3-hydroxydecanoyl-(acyl carrier protein) dehydratase
LKVGEKACGIKNVTLSEDFFDDHFPQIPIMPGVLILESLAQLSGLLLEVTIKKEYNRKVKPILTMLEKSKFRKIVKPADTLLLTTEIISVHEDYGKVRTKAFVDGKIVAESTMIFACAILDNPILEEERKKIIDFWLKDLKCEGKIEL